MSDSTENKTEEKDLNLMDKVENLFDNVTAFVGDHAKPTAAEIIIDERIRHGKNAVMFLVATYLCYQVVLWALHGMQHDQLNDAGYAICGVICGIIGVITAFCIVDAVYEFARTYYAKRIVIIEKIKSSV